MTRTFVGLMLLTDLWKDDGRWQANVHGEGLERGYTLASEGDDGEQVLQDFACDELEFVEDGTVKVYDFMGSASSDERFYERAGEVVYKDKATGRLWWMWREDIEEF